MVNARDTVRRACRESRALNQSYMHIAELPFSAKELTLFAADERDNNTS